MHRNSETSWWLSGKESAYNAGNSGSLPGPGRSPGEGNGNALHYSCLRYPMDRGTWWPQSMGSQKIRHNFTNKQQHVV